MKKGFTLAEVLITLAIIGVVAALTIPALVQNYKKKAVAVSLAKFIATWRQGVRLSHIENGEEFAPMDATTPANIVEFYKKYYMPYIKTVELEQSTCGAVASFPNGSGIYLYGRPYKYTPSVSRDLTPPYIYFCPDYKNCKNININNCNNGNESYGSDGIKVFSFYSTGRTPQYAVVGASRDTVKEYCKTEPGYCSTLIERDGWVIKDDYPHKF